MESCFESMDDFIEWKKNQGGGPINDSALTFNLVEGSGLRVQDAGAILKLVEETSFAASQINVCFMVDTLQKISYLQTELAQKPLDKITKCVQFYGQAGKYALEDAFPCVTFVVVVVPKSQTIDVESVATPHHHWYHHKMACSGAPIDSGYASKMGDLHAAMDFMSTVTYHREIITQ